MERHDSRLHLLSGLHSGTLARVPMFRGVLASIPSSHLAEFLNILPTLLCFTAMFCSCLSALTIQSKWTQVTQSSCATAPGCLLPLRFAFPGSLLSTLRTDPCGPGIPCTSPPEHLSGLPQLVKAQSTSLHSLALECVDRMHHLGTSLLRKLLQKKSRRRLIRSCPQHSTLDATELQCELY